MNMRSSETYDTATEAFDTALEDASRGLFVTDTGFSPDVTDALLHIASISPFVTQADLDAVRSLFEGEQLTS